MTASGRLICAAVTALLASACQLTPNFETGYQVERATLRAQPALGSLAVKQFE